MLNNTIFEKKNQCLQSVYSNIVRNKGQLRGTQIEAIVSGLFLKLKGQIKPLWQLFIEGFFFSGTYLSKLSFNQTARDFLTINKYGFALYDFAGTKIEKGTFLPELEKLIIDNPIELDY